MWNNHNLIQTYIRPIVGVLIKKNHADKLLQKQKPLAKQIELVKANKKAKVTLYFFSTSDLTETTVKGIFFNKDAGIWETQRFPYPDVIYKLYGTKKEPGLNRNFLTQLQERKIQTINYLFTFNKWEVYKQLAKYEDAAPHLPFTIYYNTPDDLRRMLSLYDKVYLKACQSSLGKGVICISSLAKGGYEYRFYTNKFRVSKVDTFDRLVHEVQKFFKNKGFIIQQAIDLIKIDKSIVDMRAELQRDCDGDIIIAALPVCFSNSNAHITTHATAFQFEYFFLNFMKYSAAEIADFKNRIRDFLKTLYGYIENSYGPSGELSIDIGLDKKGCLWFIECNSVSSKVSFYRAYDRSDISRSYVNILEYAKFLFRNNTMSH